MTADFSKVHVDETAGTRSPDALTRNSRVAITVAISQAFEPRSANGRTSKRSTASPNRAHSARAIAQATGNGIVIAGENYGQGSSREHAAIAPRYLGIRAKIVKSFARIHKANLVNFGILPLVFKNPDDIGLFQQGDQVSFPGIRHLVESGTHEIPVMVGGREVITVLEISERQRQELLAGGTLNFVKQNQR